MPRKFFVILFVNLIFVIVSNAQKPFRIENFEDHPVAGAPANYLDLIRLITPEVGEVDDDETSENPTIWRSFDLRNLADDEEEFTTYVAPLEVTSASGWWFKANGAKHLAMLLELSKPQTATGGGGDWQYALLVFRYDARRRVFYEVEMVNPQTDRFTTFEDTFQLIEISPGNQAFWTLNHHWNAGENFRNYEAVRVAGKNRLETAIQNIPTLYFSDGCSMTTKDYFEIIPDKGKSKTYPPYEFRYRNVKWTKKDCEQMPEVNYPTETTRVYRARWTMAKKKRRVLRLRQIKTSKRKIKFRGEPEP